LGEREKSSEYSIPESVFEEKKGKGPPHGRSLLLKGEQEDGYRLVKEGERASNKKGAVRQRERNWVEGDPGLQERARAGLNKARHEKQNFQRSTKATQTKTLVERHPYSSARIDMLR